MQKYVYFFGGGKAEGKGDMKDTLGGKGAGLAEMTNAGLPVPPGFTISTDVCRLFYDNKGTLGADIQKELKRLQSEGNRVKYPFLLYLYRIANLKAAKGQVQSFKKLEALFIAASKEHKRVSAWLVGTEFDSITGRGGSDGAPLRQTPWGEIAWQLGAGISPARAKANFQIVAEHDAKGQAPGGEGHVTVYAEVDDPQAYLDKVEQLGGRTVVPVTEMEMVTFALFADPEGHLFGITKAQSGTS